MVEGSAGQWGCEGRQTKGQGELPPYFASAQQSLTTVWLAAHMQALAKIGVGSAGEVGRTRPGGQTWQTLGTTETFM